jgi:hypothetical protein
MILSNEAKILKREIKHVTSVPDSEVDWLSVHRPSVAFAICIGAGPWQIGRRRTVQQSFIDALRQDDLSNPYALRRLKKACPLDWQVKWFDEVYSILRLEPRRSFDEYFNFASFGHPVDRRQGFEQFFGAHGGAYDFPKVVQLFLRDYLFVPCFPVDRHVRRWLKERNLPTKSREVVCLFSALSLNPSGYSRAIFNNKAQNATFEPTC